jgi:hypothetical protein
MRNIVRPRQARYQAALRPDMICTIHSKALSNFLPAPTHGFLDLFQGFAIHLQLHLGVFLEDLRVSLAQHLSHPLIRHSSST